MTACENVCRDFSWMGSALLAFLPAIVVSFTALFIAIKLYPKQKKLDRNLQVEAEKRRAVSKLIAALDELIVKVNSANAVGIEKVSYFPSEFASLEAAIAVAKLHDLADLAQKSFECRQAIQSWRRKILTAKQKRKVTRGKRASDYSAAMTEVDQKFAEVDRIRTDVFAEARNILGLNGLVATEMKSFHEDNET